MATPGSARGPQPIVGRRGELEAAESELDRVVAGGRGTIVIHGPAGIGKTSLAMEIVSAAQASGWRIIEVRGLESTPRTPLSGLARAISAARGGGADDLPEPARSAVLTAMPASDSRPAVVFAADTAIADALAGAIADLAASGPTVLAIEDVQWLDARSQGAIARIASEVRDLPLLVLVTFRDDPVAETRATTKLRDDLRRMGALDLALGTMGPRELRLVIERDVPGEDIDDRLMDALAKIAAGSPLFALEAFRGARASGDAERIDKAWRLREGIVDLPLTPNLTRLVGERIARLTPSAVDVLAVAAELGDAFGFEELSEAVASDAGEILDAIDVALRAEILKEEPLRYRFGHPILRAALRGGLPPQRRADLHARVTRALAHDIDPLDELAVAEAVDGGLDPAPIAEHASAAAGLGRKDVLPYAVVFGFAAGRRQDSLLDHAAAAETLRSALSQWLRLPEAERQRFDASTAYVDLSLARTALGDEAGARATVWRAIRVARTDLERAAAYTSAAAIPYHHGQFERADEIYREGLTVVSDPAARAMLDSGRGWLAGRAGRWPEAHSLLEPAVVILEAGPPSAFLVRSLDRLAVAVWSTEPAARSIPILERAIGLAVQIGAAGEIAALRMHLAGALRMTGDFDRAMLELETARALAAMGGDAYTEAVTEWVAADIEHNRGRLEASIGHRRRELELLRTMGGNPRHEAMATAHIAHLALLLDDRDLARAESDAARAIARHSGAPGLSAQVEHALAMEDWFAPEQVGFGNIMGTPGPQARSDGAALPLVRGTD